MTATLIDLTAARTARRKPPLHFDTDADALRFVAEHLDQLRTESREALLVPGEPLAISLDQLRAVVGACLALYGTERTGQ